MALPARGKRRITELATAPTNEPVAHDQPVQHAHAKIQEQPLPGPVTRPYIDRSRWLAELDEMQSQYEEMQRQRARREALRAVVLGLPDTGYTYPGAHTLAGAVA
ncbi:hypothetical protein [Kitasatospora griseola]|uniref:hypothetical protein n=1 Tax=Kitasatospora griseola TaxID=2064 RepID=UPI0016713B66|nr:hypothetical protein [Kitasatospora griseola]